MKARVRTPLFLASALAVSMLGAKVTAQGGFVRVEVYRDALTMVSVPLHVTDSALNGDADCVGNMMAEVLAGGPGAVTADVIWKWDAASQRYQMAFLIDAWGPPYDGRWWDEAANDYSTMTLDVGDACWIQRRSHGEAVEKITFLGWAPVEEMKTVTFVNGLTMFNYPYPVRMALSESTLGAVAVCGGGAATSDVVWEWLSLERRYRTAFCGDWWPGPAGWIDPETGELSTMEFAPGKAFWYQRRPVNPAVWKVHRPY